MSEAAWHRAGTLTWDATVDAIAHVYEETLAALAAP